MHQITSRRRAHLAIAAVLATAATVLVPLSAQAATVPTYTESRDYATDTFQDPWDYSDAADQNTDRAGGSWNVTGSALVGSLTPTSYFAPVDSTPGALPYGRDGALQPIDTSRYTHLSFSLDQQVGRKPGSVSWFTCAAKTASCQGGFNFMVDPGKHVYDLDLRSQSTAGAKVPWTGSKIIAMRIQPVVVKTTTAGTSRIDWLRIHATATGTNGAAPTAAQTTAAAMPPGDYGTYRVAARPRVVVDSPNPDEGKDLPTAQGRRPWVFTSRANAAGVNLKDAQLVGYHATNGMLARNAGPIVNDPEVLFPVGEFSGDTYHWLSWSMTYSGPFSLEDKAGGGKMARLIWYAKGSSAVQIGNDLVTWSGKNSVQQVRPEGSLVNRVDLLRRNPLDEVMAAGSPGWAKRTITSLRFDPNEDRGTGMWRLKSFHLRADPAAVGRTTVKFHDTAWVSGSTATVVMLRDGTTTRRTIADGVAVRQGSNAATFSLSGAPAGTWHARVTITHPDGSSTTTTSSAPVKMTR
jgi:hypothetical protein